MMLALAGRAASVLGCYLLWFAVFFSPVLFEGRLFPSDGMLATFYFPIELWNPLPFSGVPGLGDPQLAQLYPVRWVLASLPREIAFNAFIVFSYALASSLAFGYAFSVTRSRLAAIVGGLVYGMSGYMVAHLGHTGLIAAVAWMPLIIWSLEELRRRFSAGWFVIAALSVALVIVAGHPQAFAFSIYLAFAYAVFVGARSEMGWRRYIAMFLLIVAIGAALAAPHLLPALELANVSLRHEMTFDAFKEYALPPAQAITLLFPHLLGGGAPPVSYPFIGQWSLTETLGYVGLLPVMLAAIGSYCFRNERLVVFWLIVAGIAFLLALGDLTPLLSLTYHLPVINKLRVPARHFQEMTFAVSVLAAFGVKALQTQRASNRMVVGIAAAFFAIMLIALALIAKEYGKLQARAISEHVTLPAFSANLAIWIPIAVLVLGIFALLYWSRNRDGFLPQALIATVVAIDLASFGFYAEWRYALDSHILATPHYAARYRRDLDEQRQRFMPMMGYLEPLPAFSTIMSQLYSMPSVSGYGPLLIRRYADLSRVTQNGWIYPTVLMPSDRSADLIGARYIVMPHKSTPLDSKDMPALGEEDLAIRLGAGCGSTSPKAIQIRLPESLNANRIRIVSWTGCSTDLMQDQEVARVTLLDEKGGSFKQALRAGRDTAEWAIECGDVKPIVKHGLATVFSSWDNVRPGSIACKGHSFIANLPIDRGPYREMLLEWLPSAPNVLAISKITLVDEKEGQAYVVTNGDIALTDRERFEFVETIDSSSIYKNLRALPRAWLVPKVISARPEQILEAIKTSVSPDGNVFDPRSMAFVEDAFSLDAGGQFETNAARVIDASGSKVTVVTKTSRAAFLVLSDVYYAGWVAAIDDQEANVFQTNYALRGVAVPAGTHTVVFRYRPLAFYWGLVLAMAALIGLIATVILARRHSPCAANRVLLG